MTAVVGVDLSVTSTGIALTDGTTLTVTPSTRGDHRFPEIAAAVAVHSADADLVVIEAPVLRSAAALTLGMLHGAVRCRLIHDAVPYMLVAPATLKKFATGKGNADKTAMALALFRRTGLELANSDETDAWWLRAAGLHLLGSPIVDLPAVNVSALDNVELTNNPTNKENQQ